MKNSIVFSVSTIAERDLLIKNLYFQLTNETENEFIVQKDRINRIRVFYKDKKLPVIPLNLVCDYIVIILPISVNLAPLDSLTGHVDCRLDLTINKLEELIDKLKSMQGRRVIKENTDVETFSQLVRCLA